MPATLLGTNSNPTDPSLRGKETLEVELTPELFELLDAFAAARNDTSRAEAVAIALTEWALDRDLLPRKPAGVVPLARLNATNDI